MSAERIIRASVTLPASLAAAADELATMRGTSRSEVVRQAVTLALDPPERMQLEEALDLLDAKARSGNTVAIVKIVERLVGERDREEAPALDPAADFGLRMVG